MVNYTNSGMAALWTVLRTTAKVNGDQWKTGKFDPAVPKTPEPMAAKFGVGDDVGDNNPCANFITIRYGVIASRHRASGRVRSDSAIYFWVLATLYRETPCTDFLDLYVKWRRFAKGCAFWGPRKQNFTFRPIPPKKPQIFGQFSTGLENFASKRP